jgi:hypothetical protein
MDALEPVRNETHMRQVEYLKTEHGLGHGHANAIVHVFRTDNDL